MGGGFLSALFLCALESCAYTQSLLVLLSEYRLQGASLATPEQKVEAFHRIAEALKFGNLLKAQMSDPAFSGAQVSCSPPQLLHCCGARQEQHSPSPAALPTLHCHLLL